MRSLIRELQSLGLTSLESESALFVVEDWLRDNYPVLAQLYHVEILRKELAPRPSQVQLIPLKSEAPVVLLQEARKWKDSSTICA